MLWYKQCKLAGVNLEPWCLKKFGKVYDKLKFNDIVQRLKLEKIHTPNNILSFVKNRYKIMQNTFLNPIWSSFFWIWNKNNVLINCMIHFNVSRQGTVLINFNPITINFSAHKFCIIILIYEIYYIFTSRHGLHQKIIYITPKYFFVFKKKVAYVFLNYFDSDQ